MIGPGLAFADQGFVREPNICDLYPADNDTIAPTLHHYSHAMHPIDPVGRQHQHLRPSFGSFPFFSLAPSAGAIRLALTRTHPFEETRSFREQSPITSLLVRTKIVSPAEHDELASGSNHCHRERRLPHFPVYSINAIVSFLDTACVGHNDTIIRRIVGMLVPVPASSKTMLGCKF
jgi:hypothetical protein